MSLIPCHDPNEFQMQEHEGRWYYQGKPNKAQAAFLLVEEIKYSSAKATPNFDALVKAQRGTA